MLFYLIIGKDEVFILLDTDIITQKLTHQSMAFLKLAFPVGSLIAGALHIATNVR